MRCAAPLLVCLWLSACGMRPLPMVDAAERARPHLLEFERFERWVARAADGSAVLHDRAALSEAVFAPVRRADSVLGAWVHLPGRPAFDLALPSKSLEPSMQGALRLRDTGETASLLSRGAHGELWVAVQRPCALELEDAPPEPAAGDCVLLAREARTQIGPLRVVAAFR